MPEAYPPSEQLPADPRDAANDHPMTPHSTPDPHLTRQPDHFLASPPESRIPTPESPWRAQTLALPCIHTGLSFSVD